jgi:SSS family solute:Na+ symporter
MAWASVVKDVLMLVCALGVGIAVPALFFGSPAAMLARAMDAHPASFVVGAFFAPQGKLWFITTVALTGLGYFMSAGSFAAIYAAKSEDAVRRNAMFLPLYGILVVPIFFAGYTALLVAPGLPAGPAADSAYLHLMQRAVPVPLVAIVCAAGCLAALVPSAARILAAASLVSKNVLGDVFGIARGDVQRVWVTRLLVVAVASLALLLWLNLRASLVDLLLYVYNGVTQLVPGVFFGLFWRRISLWPVAIGLVTGELVAASLTLHPQPALLHGTNPGFCALAINAAVTVGLALVMKPARALDVPA